MYMYRQYIKDTLRWHFVERLSSISTGIAKFIERCPFLCVQVNEQFRKGLYKKQKRQDQDHKTYHDAI